MIQNFFTEVSFLDKTKDGKFFLCHSKTKHQELYQDIVPAFRRDEHSSVGLGFTFEKMEKIEKIQLPFFGQELPDQREAHCNRRDLNQYGNEISILADNGVAVTQIAKLVKVSRSAIYQLLHRYEE